MQVPVHLPLLGSAEQRFRHQCNDGQAQVSFPDLLVAEQEIILAVLIAGQTGHDHNGSTQIRGRRKLIVSGKIP